jgi:tetratricopeptide (TPR) repeat protein
LWDNGFYDFIVTLGPFDSSFMTLAAWADSAYLVGMNALATQGYAELIELYPLVSWKPYAALARLAGYSLESNDFPSLPLSAVRPEATPEAALWYAAMMDRFPENVFASIEYSAWLVQRGFITEAERLLDAAQEKLLKTRIDAGVPSADGPSTEFSDGKEVEAALALARIVLATKELVPILAMHAVATYPDSPLVADAALAALFQAAAWNQFQFLNSSRTVQVSRAWFWDSASLALSGDFASAIQQLKQSGGILPDFELSFTIASYEFAAGRFQAAAASFMIAASKAGSVPSKAKSLIQAGASYAAAQEWSTAVEAYTAALAVDEFNTEAKAALHT